MQRLTAARGALHLADPGTSPISPPGRPAAPAPAAVRERTGRGLLYVALLLVCLLGVTPSAQADHEETERRLKTEGLDDGLREAIHEAIHRGVQYLAAQQRTDGGFGKRGQASRGRDLLCALALRHANLPEGREALDRARHALFPPERKTFRNILGGVYEAGIAAMFLHADRRGDHERHIRRIYESLVRAQGKKGSWTYTTPAMAAPSQGPYSIRTENLSTAQFACLGVHAASQSVKRVPRRMWSRHLESLIETATPDGSWPYEVIQPGNKSRRNTPLSYPTGTYMGLANLVLAENALGKRHTTVRKYAEELATIRERSMRALARHARYTVRGYESGQWPMYSLYALEKVCVFLGVRDLDGLDWYREGAQRLIRFQGNDGGWDPQAWRRNELAPETESDLVNSAFALLFLLRTSESYRPITPSPVDLAILTPSERPVYPAPPATKPIEIACRMSIALQRLEHLRDLMKMRAPNVEALTLALQAVIDTYPALSPDPGTEPLFPRLATRWRSDADALMLEAFARSGKARGVKANRYATVNRLAAEGLRLSPPSLSGDLRKLIDRVHLTGSLAASSEVLGAAFVTLALWGEPDSARWLFEEVLDADRREDRSARCEQVFRSLLAFEKLPGDVRRDAVERILRTFEGVEKASTRWVFSALTVQAQKEGGVTAGNFFYWQRMRYFAMLAVHHLATDPTTRDLPRDEKGMPVMTFEVLRQWFNDHKRLNQPPWK